MHYSDRNNTIDIFRFLASFFIILLHVQYGNANENLVSIVRLLGRWGVPFFFMVSGYLFEKSLIKSDFNAYKKSFLKVFNILLVANIIYIPINYFAGHSIFKFNYLLLSDYFHLWFLNSLLLGFSIIYIFHKLKLNAYISIAIALILLLIEVLFDSYSWFFKVNPNHFYVLKRLLLSVPFMLTGTYFYKNSLFKRLLQSSIGWGFLIFGFCLQIIEALIINHYSNRSAVDLQFLFGTLFFAAGIFILSLTLKLKSNMLGKWGKGYSLFIYLYHPLFIFIWQFISVKLFFNDNLNLLLPIPIFFAIMLTALFLDKYFNPVFLLLSGGVKTGTSVKPEIE